MNERIDKINKFFKIGLIFLSLVLITKLLWISIIQHKGFSALSQNQVRIERAQNLPRGRILDRNGMVLADEEVQNDLNYIEPGIMDDEAKEALAIRISNMITLDDTVVNQVELQDFVLTKNGNLKQITGALTKEERLHVSELSENDYNQFLRDHLTQAQIDEVVNAYTPQQLKIILSMKQATSKKSVVIKDNLTIDEYYQLNLIANNCGGFYVAKDYIRTYPQGDMLRSFIGSYGQIPKEQQDVYLSQGYPSNANVGTSYLEQQLEPVLRSYSQTVLMNFDRKGNLNSSNVINLGRQGNDAYLTIDGNIQKIVEQHLTDYLNNNKYEYCRNIYASIVNPENGELLALGGKQRLDDDSIVDNSIGNFTQSYTLGSTIKPAILSLGYQSGVWQPKTVVNDEPWYILGTPKKASYTNMGPIDENEAIARSSNIYFYSILLKYAGTSYVPNAGLSIPAEKFMQVRSFLQQYGLGSLTGIGMPNENTGIEGTGTAPGLYVDLANGQYDTYTNLQQTQYAATIEELGTRYKINYLLRVQKPSLYQEQSQLLFQQTPEVLNKVNIEQASAQHVRDAMDGAREFPRSTVGAKGFKVNGRLSAKTGTSESFYFDQKTNTLVTTNTTSFLGTLQEGDKKYSMGVVIPDYTNAGNQKPKESGHVAAYIFNQMESEHV